MSIDKQLLTLLSKARTVEGKELIKIYEKMSYSAQSVRNMLSKLKKQNYITSPERSMYSLTVNGIEAVNSMVNKKNYYSKTWDRTWHIVLTDIPEVQRKKRDAFRRNLVQLGYGQLYNSVYIYPWDITSEVLSLIDNLEIEEYVTILVSQEFKINKVNTTTAAKLWNIEEKNTIYKEQFTWFKDQIEPKMERLAKERIPDSLDIFVLYLEVDQVINDLLSTDPMLPPELLPGNWTGTHVLASLYKAHDTLSSLIPAESVYRSFI